MISMLRTTKCVLFVVTCLGTAGMLAADQVVDDPAIFELDGNAQVNAGTLTDWATGTTKNPSAVFVPDASNASIFTQGGSKDTNGVNKWRWTTGAVPDKDDIADAFALAKNVSGQLLVYFGADRIANSGDANAGFWFFKELVKADGPGGTFTGHHSDGDVFVVAAFTSGGTTSSIDVYKWSCTGGLTEADCDNSGSLLLVSNEGAAVCTPSISSHTACAIANTGPVTAPWSYTPKIGSAGIFPTATFFEGGINVAHELGSSNACFASFMVETRSSTAVTAQLKDFAVNSFESCGGTITKLCPQVTLNLTGTAFKYQFGGKVENTGGAPLYDVTVAATFPNDSLTTVKLSNSNAVTCGGGGGSATTCTFTFPSLAAGACLQWPGGEPLACANAPDGTKFGTFETTSTSGGDLYGAALSAASSAGGQQIALYTAAATNCSVPSGTPSLQVTKACTTSISTSSFQSIAVTVTATGTVCNQGNVDITGVTANDLQVKTDPNDPSLLANPASASVSFITDPNTNPPTTASSVDLAACVLVGANTSCNKDDNPTSCKEFIGTLSPTLVSGGTSVSTYTFSDKVTASGSVPPIFNGGNGTKSATSNKADCPLCH
jgi:hypothetical protein